jgi:small subunit ribosomal protein S16
VAVKIRLKRMGKIRQPYYRIVVADSRTKRDGRVIEEIGKYHPKQDPSVIEVRSERAQYWIGVGAQPTEAVAAILKVTGDWQKFRGEAGAEGTLQTKPEAKTKQEIFNEILKESGSEPSSEAVTKKAAKKAPAKDEAPVAPAEEPKAEDTPAEEPKAEDTPAEVTPAEVTPAEEPKAEDTPAEEPKAEGPKAEDTPAEDASAEGDDAAKA